jgi:hypothetical protein
MLALHSRRAALSPVEIMHRDRDKATSIHSKIAGASMINAARTSKVVHLPECWATASLGTNNYIVTIGQGTPARHFTVEFDTGSDLSWVQCKPCHDCYEQKNPLFDPQRVVDLLYRALRRSGVPGPRQLTDLLFARQSVLIRGRVRRQVADRR